MSRNIFDIDAELDKIAEVYDQLAESGTEGEFLDAIERYFGDLVDERDAKLDNYARFIANRKAIAETRKVEAKRLADLAKTDENLVKSLQNNLKILFDMRGWSKIETLLHKFWVQTNGGKRPILITPGTDPKDIDSTYVVVNLEIDTEAVRADLEAGVDVPFARFGEVGTHLRVK